MHSLNKNMELVFFSLVKEIWAVNQKLVFWIIYDAGLCITGLFWGNWLCLGLSSTLQLSRGKESILAVVITWNEPVDMKLSSQLPDLRLVDHLSMELSKTHTTGTRIVLHELHLTNMQYEFCFGNMSYHCILRLIIYCFSKMLIFSVF